MVLHLALRIPVVHEGARHKFLLSFVLHLASCMPMVHEAWRRACSWPLGLYIPTADVRATKLGLGPELVGKEDGRNSSNYFSFLFVLCVTFLNTDKNSKMKTHITKMEGGRRKEGGTTTKTQKTAYTFLMKCRTYIQRKTERRDGAL